jgi:hypothetical protein
MSRLGRHRNLAFYSRQQGGGVFRCHRGFHNVAQMAALRLSSDPVFNLEASCVGSCNAYSIPIALRLASLDPSI